MSSYQAGVVLWAGCGAQSTNPESGKEEQQLHGTSFFCAPLALLSLLQPAGRDKCRKSEQDFFFFLVVIISIAANLLFNYLELNFHQHQLLILHCDAAVSLLTGSDKV